MKPPRRKKCWIISNAPIYPNLFSSATESSKPDCSGSIVFFKLPHLLCRCTSTQATHCIGGNREGVGASVAFSPNKERTNTIVPTVLRALRIDMSCMKHRSYEYGSELQVVQVVNAVSIFRHARVAARALDVATNAKVDHEPLRLPQRAQLSRYGTVKLVPEQEQILEP
jgi:hypothetical protein